MVEGYPFQPLKMKFITKVCVCESERPNHQDCQSLTAKKKPGKVYHPNISSASGAICLDILTSKAWSPVLTLRSTLVSLRSLLCSPEPNDPQDAEVAAHYKADRAGFESTAKFWTECYAKGPDNASKETVAGKKNPSGEVDPVAAAGLRKEDVDKFEGMVSLEHGNEKGCFDQRDLCTIPLPPRFLSFFSFEGF